MDQHMDEFAKRIEKKSDERFGVGKWELLIIAPKGNGPLRAETFVTGTKGPALFFEMHSIDAGNN